MVLYGCEVNAKTKISLGPRHCSFYEIDPTDFYSTRRQLKRIALSMSYYYKMFRRLGMGKFKLLKLVPDNIYVNTLDKFVY